MRILYILSLVILCSCTIQTKTTTDRYVVLSPEIAEILATLGVADRIVGITAECDYPLELKEKEIVGNFGQINLEKIISLKPSIIFTTALEQAGATEQLGKFNIKTAQFYPTNFKELIQVIDSLGVLTDKKTAADSLIAFITSKFNEFEQLSQSKSNKPRVYVEIYGDPIMSVSNTSYVGQLLYYGGMENIFETLPRDYSRINAEDVVRLNPDIIILTYPGVTATDVSNRKGWHVINAVKNNRIYTVDDINPDLILRAGPRNVEGVGKLWKIMSYEV